MYDTHLQKRSEINTPNDYARKCAREAESALFFLHALALRTKCWAINIRGKKVCFCFARFLFFFFLFSLCLDPKLRVYLRIIVADHSKSTETAYLREIQLPVRISNFISNVQKKWGKKTQK